MAFQIAKENSLTLFGKNLEEKSNESLSLTPQIEDASNEMIRIYFSSRNCHLFNDSNINN